MNTIEDGSIGATDYHSFGINAAPLSIARVRMSNGNYKTLIIIATEHKVNSNYRKLLAFSCDQNFNFKREWESDLPWTDLTLNHLSPTVSIADFDGDGYAEVLCGNKIYTAETGICLGELALGVGRIPIMYGEDMSILSSTWGDVDGDGLQEAVCGNTAYKIKPIPDRTQFDAKLVTSTIRAKNALAQFTLDGAIALADFDGDGILDVAVTCKNTTKNYLYIWKPAKPNDNILALIENPSNSTNNRGLSPPICRRYR